MCLGPGLTSLGEKVLDLSNGGLGLHLGEAQAGDKSVVAESLRARAQGPPGEVGWTGVLDNCYERGVAGRPGPQLIQSSRHHNHGPEGHFNQAARTPDLSWGMV